MNKKKLMYSILFEINNGSMPNHIDYHLELFMWAEIIEVIDDLGYVKGITIYYYGDDEWFDEAVHSVALNSPQLTNAGIEFLEENIVWNKSYSGIANLNEWLEI
ncbi:YjcQ family protein [Psychrobacillus sp. OK032]|uniref:YjcQ family protein n=1 Tax=Psychrobacillus sp. OK032 TaxID=1884358 RepID=UPI0008CF9F06|nr:YjcQ family protein [Psychrobacillus sp. OK032]SES07165.1 YjcQ protein [Psychrobacillus sp. OK032]